MKKFSWYTTKEKDRHGRYVGAEVFGKGGPFAFCKCYEHYKPNRKGGHTHNHIYNVCNRILFRSKNGRKIDPTKKQEWRRIFEIQAFGELKRIAKVNFLDILKKGKSARITKKRRINVNGAYKRICQ